MLKLCSIQNLKGSVSGFRHRVLECGSKVVGTIDTLISGCKNELFSRMALSSTEASYTESVPVGDQDTQAEVTANERSIKELVSQLSGSYRLRSKLNKSSERPQKSSPKAIGFVTVPLSLGLPMPFLSLNTAPIGKDSLSDEMMELFMSSHGYIVDLSGHSQLLPLDSVKSKNVTKVKESYRAFAKLDN